jgi:hypothetical protein
MINLVSKKRFLTFFSIFAILISGCALDLGMIVSPITSGVVYWVNGEAHKYYKSDIDTIYRSLNRVMLELDQKIYHLEIKPGKKYKIIAASKNRFSIRLDKIDENICRMNIRINYLGDKDFAELIYKEIDKQIDVLEFKNNGKITNYEN